jgi:hypothetical protein
MTEETDYETFPHDSFIFDIDYEDVPELQVDGENNMAEMTEAETEITEAETAVTETEKSVRSTVSSQAPVWQYFEKRTEEKDEEEESNSYILCHICQVHLSIKNSTSTLERHLKSKHPDAFEQLKKGVKIRSDLWTAEIQKEKHNLFINWIITD